MRTHHSPLLHLLKMHYKTLLLGAILGAVIVIAACGGGSNSAGVGSGGTGAFSVTAYSEGTITGFGSVIVNGLRYDDGLAVVRDEEGLRSRSDLKLGMVVAVDGKVDSNNSASASVIRYDSALLGPVKTVSLGSKTFTVMGQTVYLDNSTVLDASLAQGLASISSNDVVEVHGFLNAATNQLQATLVERKTSVSKYKISGLVQNQQVSAKTFMIGNEKFSYAEANLESIANGNLVKLRLQPRAPTGTEPWVVAAFSTQERSSASQERAEIEGLVTQVNSATQFSVSNILVDTRNASFPNGNSAITITIGMRIKAKGKLLDGILTATEVKAESRSSKDIELKGTVSDLNTVSKTFTVRGVSVNYSPPVEYEKGTEASLATGVAVEVEGNLIAGTSTVKANNIKFLK